MLMQNQLMEAHALYPSVEEMLSPEALSDLLATRVSTVQCQPVVDHGGLAGGQLFYVQADTVRLVLKRMSIESDWLMFATNDHQCRSVTLWQYGLLDRLCPHLAHKIVACAQDNDGWAILMYDLSDSLFTEHYPMTDHMIYDFLDRLAQLHATFWNDPLLDDPCLGLCNSAELLNLSALSVARRHFDDFPANVVPTWIIEGWEVMAEQTLLESDVFENMSRLVEDPSPLFDALSRYPVTLIHGDYREANLAYIHPDQPIAIDWQAATRSLMTIDLAWFCPSLAWSSKDDSDQAMMKRAQEIAYYRGCLEAYLETSFDETQWQAMVDLGNLMNAVRGTCFAAYWYRHTSDLASRTNIERVIMIRNQEVRDALRWL